MNREIEWRCKTDHPHCEARDWKPYKEFTESDAERFICDVAPNSRNFDYRMKPDETAMNVDTIYECVRLQCPVFAVNFAKDPPFGGNHSLGIFHSTEIVPEFDGKTETIHLEITSERFCLIAMRSEERIAPHVAEMYSKIKRLVEQTVGDKLAERNASTVIGKDKSCLYGEWSVARDGPMIQFTCKVNLTHPASKT